MATIRRRLARGALVMAALLLGGSTIGQQDLAGLLAQQPGVAERARVFAFTASLQSLKLATFSLPVPLGTSVPPPPRPVPAIAVNRVAKGDREMKRAPAGVVVLRTDAGPASQATGGTFAGVETETDDEVVTAAGDPTGDASEIDNIGLDMPTDDMVADDATPSTGDLSGDAVAENAAADPRAPVTSAGTDDPPMKPIYREASLIFEIDPTELPAQAFEHMDGGETLAAKGDVTGEGAQPSSPAERLGLEGTRLAKAEKCLANAVYFESRGEPYRGQVGVAQVVMNRVFSGYYPADVCKAVYQNSQRHNACQFTFACDDVRDVVNEPDMWAQAERIASDMLGGRLWDDKVGKATHYHASWVRPNWIGEMRKLDRIGVHTFYRPRRWEG